MQRLGSEWGGDSLTRHPGGSGQRGLGTALTTIGEMSRFDVCPSTGHARVPVAHDELVLETGVAHAAEAGRANELASVRLRESPAEPLPPALAVQVGQIASKWPNPDPNNPRKHFGEIATVLMAKNRGAVAVVDDGNGQGLARRKGVDSVTTRDIAVCMAANGALGDEDAATVWARVFRTRSARSDFYAAVRTARAALASPASRQAPTGAALSQSSGSAISRSVQR
jgi:hypothetical protein